VLADQMADRLDRGMFERYREIQLFASLLGGPGGLAPPERVRPLLAELQRTFEHHAWLGLVDVRGEVKAATDGLLEGEDVSNRIWFRRGLVGPYVGDVHESLLLAELLPPSISGEPPRFVDISAPVRGPGGETIGVLAAHLSWDWAEHVKRSILEPVKHRRGIDVFVLSRDGSVLLGPDEPPPILPERPESEGYFVDRGGEHAEVVGFAPADGHMEYPGLGWMVVVRQDAAIAFAPAHALQRWIFRFGLVVGGAFAIGGWLLSAHMIRPLGAITRAAERIRAGERDVHIPLARGKDEIASLSSSLHDLVQELTTREVQLRERVREREDFLSIAAHELKTPIAGISARVQVLERRLERRSLDEAQLRKYITELRRGSDQLTRLTGRLFDLSQLEAGKLELDLRDTDVSALVRDAAEAAQARAPEREIACRVPAGVRAELDAGRMQQVLTNLLDNALKFSPEGGLIDVELTRGEAALTLAVRDRGLGIAPERRARLFEKHYQAHAADHRSGLGLGLYISRQIVELHGGTLAAEFPEDGGTRMTVVLPIRTRVSPPEGGGS
ncbi:MAG TPA: sensor histidine kinase, partial [Candidatus Nanopelagicales bacterium]|nr:sensor histidine kinase [Candidatus Nanopelagicales bacterium]